MKLLLKWGSITFGVLLLTLLIYNFLPQKPLPTDKKVDKLVVEKSKRQLLVFSKNELLKTYPISLGFGPVGHKEAEGDGRPPEGIYFINDKNPESGYYLNLGISYPNRQDTENAKKKGFSPGGDIKIHGLRNGLGFLGKLQRSYDWTHGCIALTNPEVKELFDHVPVGTEIEIKK